MKRTFLSSSVFVPLFLGMAALPGKGATILVDYDDGDAGNGIHDTAVLDGDFSNQTAEATTSNPPWVTLTATQYRSNLGSGVGSNINFVAQTANSIALDTGHTISVGDGVNLSYMWRDAWNWDADDQIKVVLYYTDDDAIDNATKTDLFTLAATRTTTATWETVTGSGTLSDGAGRTLFLRVETVSQANEFCRFDNVYLDVVPVPEPTTASLVILGLLGLRRRRR